MGDAPSDPLTAQGDAAVSRGEAGRSAQAVYEARRDRREERARRRLGRLGVVVVRLRREPAWLAAWRRGAAGERRLATRLHQLLDGDGVELLHDRRLERQSRANIDHLAVGPGGVTVIDAKNIAGRVRVERYGLFPRRERLRIAGRDRTRYVRALERQVAAVEEAIAAAGLEVDTAGALCMVDPRGLPLLGRRLRIDGMVVGGTKAVARLARREGELTGEQIEVVRRVLCARFPAA